MKLSASIAASVILVVGILVQSLGPTRSVDRMQPIDMATVIPLDVAGWTVEDRPLADSPELLRRVESLLSYDSAVYRTYRRGTEEVSVYIAYWLPGKVHREVVDEHTPDVCWVGNGWTMEHRPPLDLKRMDDVELTFPNHRVFVIKGRREAVLYWHIEGSQLQVSRSIDQSRVPFIERNWQKVVRWRRSVFEGPQQQFFIRISSRSPIETQLNTEPANACLQLIARILRGDQFYHPVQSMH